MQLVLDSVDGVAVGVDLETVQELMGRKTIAMTVRYAHLAAGNPGSSGIDFFTERLQNG